MRRSTVENSTVNNANLLAATHHPNDIFILSSGSYVQLFKSSQS